MALTLSVGLRRGRRDRHAREHRTATWRQGKRRSTRPCDGSREIGFTILSMTISLVAVFIPVLFMGGLLGRLFHEFAVTISVAILVSGFVSLTLTPMLCSRFLRREDREDARAVAYQALGARLQTDRSRALRADAASRCCGHRRATLAMLSLMAVLDRRASSTSCRRGSFRARTRPDPERHHRGRRRGSRSRPWRDHQQAVAAIVRADPDVECVHVVASARAAANSSANQGRLFITAQAAPSESRSADEVIDAPAAEAGAGAGHPRLPPEPAADQHRRPEHARASTSSRSRARTPRRSTRIAALLERKLHGLPQLQDVTSDLQIKNPELDVDDRPRRGRGARRERPGRSRRALYDAYGTRQVSTIYTPTNEYWVILEVDARGPARRQRARAPLHPLVDRQPGAARARSRRLTPSVGPLLVEPPRPASGGDDLVQSAARASRSARRWTPCERRRARRCRGHDHDELPGHGAGVPVVAAGAVGSCCVLAVLVIYLVLGILYESFIHPLTILSGLPLAGFGALLTLMVFGTDLNIYAFVGHHHAGRDREEERDHDDRLRAGGAARAKARRPARRSTRRASSRFRPIMMTTMAALDGHAADRARPRARRRVAPPLGPRGGRRPGLLAAPDALHHAGRLPRVRVPRCALPLAPPAPAQTPAPAYVSRPAGG